MLITSNVPDFTVTYCFHLHSLLLFPASMMPLLFMQLRHTLWLRLGQTQFRHLFCDVLVLVFRAHDCYMCTSTFHSPHWCRQNFSPPTSFWVYWQKFSYTVKLHISGHRCNCKLFVNFMRMIQIVLASGSLSVHFWILCEHYESQQRLISHNLFHDTIWYLASVHVLTHQNFPDFRFSGK